MENIFNRRMQRCNMNNKSNLNRIRRKNIALSLERITNNLVFLQHRQ